MCRLLETIKLDGGVCYNLAAHEARRNKAATAVFGCMPTQSLKTIVATTQPPQNGLFKCRVVYGREGASVSYVPYQPKPIRTLRVVTNNTIEYVHKWEDRAALDALYQQRAGADDIIIVKNGMVTDASYANVAFWRAGIWYTPAEPLLHGTMRKKLLDEGVVQEGNISIEDLNTYEAVKPFNAMMGFAMLPVPIKAVLGM